MQFTETKVLNDLLLIKIISLKFFHSLVDLRREISFRADKTATFRLFEQLLNRNTAKIFLAIAMLKGKCLENTRKIRAGLKSPEISRAASRFFMVFPQFFLWSLETFFSCGFYCKNFSALFLFINFLFIFINFLRLYARFWFCYYLQ